MVINVIFVAYGYEMGEFECDKNDLWDSKMAIGSHFVQSCKLIWNDFFNVIKNGLSDIQNGRQLPFCKHSFFK